MEDSCLKFSGIELPKEYGPLSDELYELRDSQYLKSPTKNKKFQQSLDLSNILRNDDRLRLLNSHEQMPSLIRATLKFDDNKLAKEEENKTTETPNNFVFAYNDKDKNTILNKANKKPLEIVQMDSEEDEPDQTTPAPMVFTNPTLTYGLINSNKQEIINSMKQQDDKAHEPFVPPHTPILFTMPKKPRDEEDMLNQEELDKLREFLPPELQQYLQALPKEYLRGYFDAKNQPEIKSDRRKRVERYLEKRRMKTWNKKICYNCRQKVAEERLRIKGRFVPRKKVLQILKTQQGGAAAVIPPVGLKLQNLQPPIRM